MNCKNCGQPIMGRLRDHVCDPADLPPQPDPGIVAAIAEDETRVDLGGLMATLQRVQTEKNAKKALADIRTALGNLDDESMKIVLADEGVTDLIAKFASSKESGMKPGDPIFDEKGREIDRVPFTSEWISENMPTVEWTVPQPMNGTRSWDSCSWNGYIYPGPLVAGETITTPVFVRSQVMEAYNQQRMAYEKQEQVLKFGPSAAGEGFSMSVGWSKLTESELVASGEWRDQS